MGIIGSVDGSFIRPLRGRQASDITTPGSERRTKTTLLGSSPPKPPLSSGVNLSNLPAQSKRTHSKASKKKKAFNPFRQQDEDAVLAEKSHNRRRWSHVFPATEVEFKRHVSDKSDRRAKDRCDRQIITSFFATGRAELEESVSARHFAHLGRLFSPTGEDRLEL